MAKVDDNVFPKVIADELGADPAAAAAGTRKLYAKSDGWYDIDDAGSVTGPFGAGGGGGATFAYAGKNAIGASSENLSNLRMYCKKITTVGAVSALGIGFYGHQNNSDNVVGFHVGIWDDDTNTVGNLLAANATPAASYVLRSSAGAGSDRWFEVPISLRLAAATVYWIGIIKDSNGSSTIYYDTSGSDRTIDTAGGYWLSDGDRYAQTDSTKDYSIRLATIA